MDKSEEQLALEEARKYSVFVSGFPYESNEKEVQDYFSECGTILLNLFIHSEA